MKIISFKSENIKRLEVVEIEPEGSLVQITGSNGAGKTSVLDSIWWALAGANSHQDRPIRKGQTSARVRLDMGEIIVSRKFRLVKSKDEDKPDRITTQVTVETGKGARYRSPQSMLDSLVGSLSFDYAGVHASGREAASGRAYADRRH